MAEFDVNAWTCAIDCYQSNFALDNAPLAVTIIGAWMMPRWRDLPFVAAVALTVQIAGILVRWPGLPIYAVAHPGVLGGWTMLPIYFVLALGMAAIVHGVKLLLREEDASSS